MFARKKILKVWDQAARKVPGSHVEYGCVYSKVPKRWERPLAEYEGDPKGHGSHVAGTACGQHERWGGIAPDAPLIVVKTPMYDHHLEDALDWIHAIAEKEGMPVVTNMSLGGLWTGTVLWLGVLMKRLGRGRFCVLLQATRAMMAFMRVPTGAKLIWWSPSPITTKRCTLTSGLTQAKIFPSKLPLLTIVPTFLSEVIMLKILLLRLLFPSKGSQTPKLV
mmetsp:Transcript_26026/g.40605  ORF Transcript_26026/g.40605 Transcript_26026/m.40605 type:complete len:221 (+) Transcript_26026:576-1238(+)